MNYQKFIYILALVVLTVVMLSGGNANAQTTAVGPYYAPPSWDQTLPSSTRFIVLSNFGGAAVLDRETGLVWQKSPSSIPLSWTDSQFDCGSLPTGNRRGWRLPTLQDLASLVDPTQSNPALPTGHPFQNVQSSFYWSATTSAADTSLAWTVNFSTGTLIRGVKSTASLRWCVRGGQGVDAQ